MQLGDMGLRPMLAVAVEGASGAQQHRRRAAWRPGVEHCLAAARPAGNSFLCRSAFLILMEHCFGCLVAACLPTAVKYQNCNPPDLQALVASITCVHDCLFAAFSIMFALSTLLHGLHVTVTQYIH